MKSEKNRSFRINQKSKKMDKYFVCLAVSYKCGGRCIGGVEVVKNLNNTYSIVKSNGVPKWVRPVTRGTVHGEIPTSLSSTCRVLDVVKLVDAIACPNGAQSENYYFRSIEKVGHFEPNSQVLDLMCDNSHSLIFGNAWGDVSVDSYERLGYSLMLIKVTDVRFFTEQRYASSHRRLRVRFSYDNEIYNLPVTDPILSEKADQGVEDLNGKSAYYFTISLGVEFRPNPEFPGKHYKLVANVIPMN